jgi:subtilase family serine protease
MNRSFIQSLLIFCMFAGAAAAQPRLIKGQIQDKERFRMTGHVHPRATAENDVGTLDASETLPAITLIFRQTPQQQADLDRLLTAQQDPSSADYHRWLSPEEYADRFGASADDIGKITAWLEQHNLHVTTVGRARTSVAFTGVAGDVEQALQVKFHRYSVNGRNHFANTAEPSLPVAIETAIRAIHGLNDFRMQPRAILHRTLDANYTSTTSSNHYLSPDDLATIYNIKGLWNAGYDGAGQKIVIAGQTRVDLADIQQFRAKFQLPAADPQLILVPNTRDPGTVKAISGRPISILSGPALPLPKRRCCMSTRRMSWIPCNTRSTRILLP